MVTHIQADRPHRPALTAATHASLNPEGESRKQYRGNSEKAKVSQCPRVHERHPPVCTSPVQMMRGRRGVMRGEGVSYKYRTTRVKKPDDVAKEDGDREKKKQRRYK